MCYGFLGPLASNLQKINDDGTDYLRCLIAFVKGSPPVLGGKTCFEAAHALGEWSEAGSFLSGARAGVLRLLRGGG